MGRICFKKKFLALPFLFHLHIHRKTQQGDTEVKGKEDYGDMEDDRRKMQNK